MNNDVYEDLKNSLTKEDLEALIKLARKDDNVTKDNFINYIAEEEAKGDPVQVEYPLETPKKKTNWALIIILSLVAVGAIALFLLANYHTCCICGEKGFFYKKYDIPWQEEPVYACSDEHEKAVEHTIQIYNYANDFANSLYSWAEDFGERYQEAYQDLLEEHTQKTYDAFMGLKDEYDAYENMVDSYEEMVKSYEEAINSMMGG